MKKNIIAGVCLLLVSIAANAQQVDQSEMSASQVRVADNTCQKMLPVFAPSVAKSRLSGYPESMVLQLARAHLEKTTPGGESVVNTVYYVAKNMVDSIYSMSAKNLADADKVDSVAYASCFSSMRNLYLSQ